jgi:iron complex outermembrane receptor protein
MRGVFASASVPAQDRQISSYIDGVYVGGTRGAVFDLPDLERIEVLRGPQGTLFGRNATAGAVSIVTRDPRGELKVRQEVTVGNLSQLRTRTTIDTPKLGILSAYVTYVHDEHRGDVRNLGAGVVFDRTSPIQNVVGRTVSPTWLGNKNADSVFAALKLEPSDAFSVTYKFDHSNNQITPEARATLVINPNDFVGGALSAIYGPCPASSSLRVTT